MPDDIIEKLKKEYGITKPPAPKTSGDDTVARTLDDEFSKLGYPSTARQSMLGDVGRENSWNRDTIFKGHPDPANGAFNRGIISWQGDRQDAMNAYLKKEGVYGKNDDNELRGMARFMDDELKTQYPDVHKKLLNPKSTYDASEALRQYIKYVPDGQYNTYDPEFRVKNNATWAKRAKELGLAQDSKGPAFDYDAAMSKVLGQKPAAATPYNYDAAIKDATNGGSTQTGPTNPANVMAPSQTTLPPATPYTKRDTTKPGDYWNFETSGKAGDLNYLGMTGGKHIAENGDGDKFQFDEATKTFQPVTPLLNKLTFDGGRQLVKKQDDIYVDQNNDEYKVTATPGEKGGYNYETTPVSPYIKQVALTDGTVLERDAAIKGGGFRYRDQDGTPYIYDAKGIREANPPNWINGKQKPSAVSIPEGRQAAFDDFRKTHNLRDSGELRKDWLRRDQLVAAGKQDEPYSQQELDALNRMKEGAKPVVKQQARLQQRAAARPAATPEQIYNALAVPDPVGPDYTPGAKTIKTKDGRTLTLDTDPTSGVLPEGAQARYLDDSGNSFTLQSDGSFADESLAQIAVSVPVKKVPINMRNSVPVEDAKQRLAYQVADQLGAKYGLDRNDTYQWILKKGITDVGTTDQVSESNLYQTVADVTKANANAGSSSIGDPNAPAQSASGLDSTYSLTGRQLQQLLQEVPAQTAQKEKFALDKIAQGAISPEPTQAELDDLGIDLSHLNKNPGFYAATQKGLQAQMNIQRVADQFKQTGQYDDYEARFLSLGELGIISKDAAQAEIAAKRQAYAERLKANEFQLQSTELGIQGNTGRSVAMVGGLPPDTAARRQDRLDYWIQKGMAEDLRKYGSFAKATAERQRAADEDAAAAERVSSDMRKITAGILTGTWAKGSGDAAQNALQSIVFGTAKGAIKSWGGFFQGFPVWSKTAADYIDSVFGTQSSSIKDNAMYQFGKWIKDTADYYLPTNKDYDKSFAFGSLPQGAGSSFGFMPAARGGPLGIALFSTMQMTGDSYEEALNNGAKETDARMYARLNGAIFGWTETLGLGQTWQRMLKGGAGAATWKKLALDALKESAEEVFLNEGPQDLGQNLLAKITYDPDRKWDKDVGDGMAAAGISAPLVSVMVSALLHVKHSRMIKRMAMDDMRNGGPAVRDLGEEAGFYGYGKPIAETEDLKPLFEKHRELQKEIDGEFEALKSLQRRYPAFQDTTVDRFGRPSQVTQRPAKAIGFIRDVQQQILELVGQQRDVSKEILVLSGIPTPDALDTKTQAEAVKDNAVAEAPAQPIIPKSDEELAGQVQAPTAPNENVQPEPAATETPEAAPATISSPEDVTAAIDNLVKENQPTNETTNTALPTQPASVDENPLVSNQPAQGETANAPVDQTQAPETETTQKPGGTSTEQSTAAVPRPPIKLQGIQLTQKEQAALAEESPENIQTNGSTQGGSEERNSRNKGMAERGEVRIVRDVRNPDEFTVHTEEDKGVSKIPENQKQFFSHEVRDKHTGNLIRVEQPHSSGLRYDSSAPINTAKGLAKLQLIEKPETEAVTHDIADEGKSLKDLEAELKGETASNEDENKATAPLTAKQIEKESKDKSNEQLRAELTDALIKLRGWSKEQAENYGSPSELRSLHAEILSQLAEKDAGEKAASNEGEKQATAPVDEVKKPTVDVPATQKQALGTLQKLVAMPNREVDRKTDLYGQMARIVRDLRDNDALTPTIIEKIANSGQYDETALSKLLPEHTPTSTTDEADDLFEQAFSQKYGKPETAETPEEVKEPETTTTGPMEVQGGTEEVQRKGNDLIHTITPTGVDPISKKAAKNMKLPRTMRYVDLDEKAQSGIRKAIGATDLEADALIFAVDDKNKVAFAYNPTIPSSSGQFISSFPTSKGRETAQHLVFEGMLLKYERLADTLKSLETTAKPDQKKAKAPKATTTPATPAQNDALTNLAAAFGFEIPEAPKVEGPQLEDFGQKIGGARKDLWADRGLTFADVAAMIPRERESLVRKDQIWPKPDYTEIYERFLEQGFTQEDASRDAYLVKMVYDGIDQPPIKKWTRYDSEISDAQWQKYIDFVTKVRNAMSEALETATDSKWPDAFKEAITTKDGPWRSIDTTFANRVLSDPAGYRYKASQKAKALGFPSKRELWMREYQIADGNKLTVKKWYANAHQWVVEVPHAFSHLEKFDTEEEARAYAKDFEGGHLLLNRSGKLIQSFATEQAAAEAARKRYADAHKRPTGEPTRPMLQGIKRGGVDYLQGKHAKPEQFVETFGFRGVEFGNWLSKEDRQQSLDHAYNALMDLANVLHVAPQALSLSGKLSLAFGSRGRKGALAHYEPSRIVINLTKMSGAGSVAHEWAHALDDYFGSQSETVPYGEGRHMGYASQMVRRSGLRQEMQRAWSGVVSRIIERNATNEETVADALASLNNSRNNTFSWVKSVFHPIRDTEQFNTALDTLKKDFDSDMPSVDAFNKFVAELTPLQKLKAKDIKILDDRRYWLGRGQTQLERAVAGEIVKKSPTDYITHAKNLDKMFKSKPYWSTVLEMFARAFESYVQDRTDSKSQYLVHGTDAPVQEYTGKNNKTLPASPYPQGSEREAINAAFDHFFDVVEQETGDDGTVSLKSVLPSDGADNRAEERYQAIIKPALADAFAQYAFEHDTPIEAMMNLLNALESRGFTEEQIRQMKPDITRFARENFLQKPKEESIDKGDDGRTDINQDSEGGDGGPGTADVQGTPSDELAGPGDQRPGELGDSDVPADVSDGAKSSSDDEKTGASTGTGGVSTGTRGPRSGNNSGNGISEPESDAGNYVAPDGSLTRKGSWRDAANNNLDAIELAKKIEAEGRRATLAEQEILAKFVGWGAGELANNVFKDPNGYSIKPEWKEVATRLRSLLTPEELATAERSTQYAHYTSEKIVRGIWSAVQQFGFEDGSILEPGMGIGLFPIAAPKSLIEKSAYTGIEMDAMTARIAKLLLPDKAVLETDFIKQTLPDNHFDVAIGNPPFSRTTILADPKYKKNRFLLHDYFFAKSLDSVRPGGLLVFVTSKGTMDKAGDAARKYMAEKADLLGAIRLPQTAFKDNAGTDVVTDVLFFRKRMEGEEPGGEKWLAQGEVTAKNKWDEDHTGAVNEYFINHPEMVLGEHSFTGTMRHGDNEYTVIPKAGDIEEQFQDAIKNLPTGVFAKEAKSQEIINDTADRDWDPKAKKEGSLYIHDDGRLMRREGGSGVEVQLTDKETKWLKDYVGLRDALKQAQFDQLHAEDEGQSIDWEKSLKDLNKTYDAFVKKHGNILEYTDRERTKTDADGNEIATVSRSFKNEKLLFGKDIESPLVWSLERITDDGDIVKSKWLKDRIIKPPDPPKIENIKDALMVSLDNTGSLNIGHIVQLMAPIKPTTEDEVIQTLGDLIYEAPGSGWQMADEYLSGNVKDKLEAAEAAAADPRYRRNVEALRKVQPLPLPPEKITIQIGATWVPVDHVNEFADKVLGMTGIYDRASSRTQPIVEFDSVTNTWTVPGAHGPGSQNKRQASSEWGTSDRSPEEILEAALNSQTVTITKTDPGPPSRKYMDKDGMAQVQAIIEKMNDAFGPWLFEDPGRQQELVDYYNRKMNVIARREFNGEHLTTPGLSFRYALYPHQKRAVWRIIQTGNTYLAHAVGAGKTLEMIVSAMEQKRLGKISKPMMVVPRHMLEQFASDFLSAYPLANIMVADEQNFHTDNRRKFIAQAALNDLDAIIIPHSSFGLLRTTEESSRIVLDDLLSEMRDAMDALTTGRNAKGEPKGDTLQDTATIKRIQQRIEAIEQKFLGRMNSARDNVLDFEEMGVDFLYVDEAHEFRKLDFTTNQSNLKGVDSMGSMRALDLLVKARWLDRKRPGRSLVLASGTPLTNTMAELYTIQRFLGHRKLIGDGLDHFDGWARQYGKVEENIEPNAAGQYQPVKRFQKFVNTGVLMQGVQQFMDILTLKQMVEEGVVKVPTVKGGKPQIVVGEPPAALVEYKKDELSRRIKASKEWKPSPPDEMFNPDPMIAIIGDAQLAGFDMRFIDPTLPNDPTSKLNLMIDGIIDSYQASNDIEYFNPETGEPYPIKGASHIAFTYGGIGEGVIQNRGFDSKAWIRKRLIEGGIPNNEIAFMSDYPKTSQKEAMFREMREGKKKILIATPKNAGTGVNVQLRLKTLHYGMAPWYPADVEQPDGRIVRQGNQNEEVELTRYAIKATYDESQWAMLSRKSRNVEDVLMGNYDGDVEDLSESSQYAMASALVSGDPRAIRVATLRGQIEKYTRLEQGYHSTQARLQYQIRDLDSSLGGIPTVEQSIKNIDEAIAAAPKEPVTKDTFSITIGKETFNKDSKITDTDGKSKDVNNADIGTAIKKAWLDQIAKSKKRVLALSGIDIPFTLATVQGKFPINGTVWQGHGGEIYSKLSIDIGPVTVRLNDSPFGVNARLIQNDVSESGLITRIYNAFNGLKDQKTHNELALAEKQAEKAKAEAALARPFEHGDELAAARAELDQLQKEMVSDGIATPAESLTAQDIRSIQDAYQPNLVPGSREDTRPEPMQPFSNEEVDALQEAHHLATLQLRPLKSVLGDHMTEQQLRDMPYVPIETVLDKAEMTRQGDLLKMNAASQELLRRAEEQVRMRAAEKAGLKINPNDYSNISTGTFLDPKDISDTVTVLREKAQEATDLNYPPEQVKVFTDHADMLEAAAKEGKGTAVTFVLDKALPHERFHQADYLGAAEKTILNRHTEEYKKKLDNHAVRNILWEKHFSQFNDYNREKSKRMLNAKLRAEVPTYLLELSDKELSDLGITPEMRADYMLTWFEGYAAKNGLDSLDNFEKDELDVQNFIEQVKAANQAQPQENGSTGEANEESPGGLVDQPGSETGTNPEGDRGTVGGINLTAETHFGRRIEKRQAEKDMGLGDDQRLRSLPLTLRRAGLEVLDDTYDVFHDGPAIEAATALLEEHGIAGSIELLRTLPAKALDAEHGILSFMLIKTLQTHAASIRDTNPELARQNFELSLQIGREHAIAATQLGRFTRVPSIVGPSVETLKYAIQGIVEAREGNFNKTLPPEAWERIEGIGRELEAALTKISELRKAKRNVQAQNKRLKDQLEGKKPKKRSSQSSAKYGRLFDRIQSDKSRIKAVNEAIERQKAQFAKVETPEDGPMKSVLSDPASIVDADAVPLDQDTLNDFALIGAMKLAEGLAGDGDYLPSDFKAEMIAEFNDAILPHFDEIYKAAWNKREEWLAEERYKTTKERVQRKYDETAAPEDQHELEDWEVDEILGEQKQAAKRRRFIERYHEITVGAKKGRRNYEAYKAIIADLTKDMSDNITLGALVQAEGLGTADIHKRMIAFGITEAKDQREALREGNKVWLNAQKIFKDQQDKLANDILEAEGEEHKIDELLWIARNELKKSQASVADEMRRIKNGEGWYRLQQLANVMNASRTMMASFDLSGALRQGGFFSFATPELQGKAFANMFKSIGDKGFGKAITDIEAGPNFVLSERAGIDYAVAGKTSEGSLMGEELFKGEQTIEAIPIIGKLVAEGVVKWSERTYTAFLDTQRYVMFDVFAKELMSRTDSVTGKPLSFRTHPEEFKKIADFINIATGRGVMPSNKFTKVLMDLPLFAPRYTISRLQLLNMTLNPVAYWNMPPQARKIVAKNAVRFYGTTMGILGLITAFGAAVGASVNWDDDDSDFLKVKIGSSKHDIFAGTLQPARMIIRIVHSAIRTKGGFANRLPGEFLRDIEYAVGRYLRGKLSPLASFGVDFGFDEDYVGQKFNYQRAIVSRLVPLTFGDIYDTYKLDGVVGVARLVPPAVFGLGVSTYKDRPEQPETEAEKLAAKAFAWSLPAVRSAQDQKDLDQRSLVQELRAKSRKGEDVKAEVDAAVAAGKITKIQRRNILAADSKSYLIDTAEGLSLNERQPDFLRVWEAADASERAALQPLFDKKMKALLVKGSLSPEFRQRLEAAGGKVLGDAPMPPAVQSEFDDLGLNVPDVGEDLTLRKGAGKTKLDTAQYDSYRRKALTRIYNKVDELIKGPDYKNADDETKTRLIERVIRRQRSKALETEKSDLRDE